MGATRPYLILGIMDQNTGRHTRIEIAWNGYESPDVYVLWGKEEDPSQPRYVDGKYLPESDVLEIYYKVSGEEDLHTNTIFLSKPNNINIFYIDLDTKSGEGQLSMAKLKSIDWKDENEVGVVGNEIASFVIKEFQKMGLEPKADVIFDSTGSNRHISMPYMFFDACAVDENKDYLLVVEVKSTTVCRERIDEILDGRITDKEGRSAQQQLIDAAKKWNHNDNIRGQRPTVKKAMLLAIYLNKPTGQFYFKLRWIDIPND